MNGRNDERGQLGECSGSDDFRIWKAVFSCTRRPAVSLMIIMSPTLPLVIRASCPPFVHVLSGSDGQGRLRRRLTSQAEGKESQGRRCRPHGRRRASLGDQHEVSLLSQPFGCLEGRRGPKRPLHILRQCHSALLQEIRLGPSDQDRSS